MWIKEYNSNRYIFLNYDDYSCKRFFYDELIRIQYNKIYSHPNTIEELRRYLKDPSKQVTKQKDK
jgi:hypothetical protein